MKPIWIVIGVIAIVLGLAGAFAIGAFAFAQRPFTPVVGAAGQGWNMMGPGYGGMAGRGAGMVGRGAGMTLAPHASAGVGSGVLGGFTGQQNSLIEIAAKDLNLNVNDLITELQRNKSIADVAKEKGISTDKIADDYVAARTQALKSAVEANQITQAQADAMLTLTKANAAQALTRTHTAGAFGLGMMGQNWNGVAPVAPNMPMMGGRMGGMMGGRGGWR